MKHIYDVAIPHMATDATPIGAIPMTDDLTHALAQAQAEADRRDEPLIDGDLAGDCQDCGGLSGLTITMPAPPANGRAVVSAHFILAGPEARTVLWDMVKTPQGWRVDNIRSDSGSDLRNTIRQELTPLPVSCTQSRGTAAAQQLAQQCTAVSPATHPPCNADNACDVIQAEITRGCGLLAEKDRPAFCRP